MIRFIAYLMKVIKGLIFKPCAFLASITKLYMVSFVCMACLMNVSCVKVNTMICMVRSGVGIMGSYCLYDASCMYTMSDHLSVDEDFVIF
jgi:hypothetical protein